MEIYKKFIATIVAFVMACVNHFVLMQPNPDLDKLVCILTISFHAFQTIADSVRAGASILHHIVDVNSTKETPNGVLTPKDSASR